MYKAFLKRAIDTLLSAVGILFLLLPMAVIAVLIKIDSQGPVLFRQEREGKNRKPFKICKFRTMCDNAYAIGGIATRSDDPRITKVGDKLRRYSLDELPQLFNIFLGQMAIIGPRPILDWQFDEFKNNENYARYHSRFDVLPGMFCTVDLCHRDAERELQFEMDADYVANISFIGDLKLFFGIIKTVLSGKGVYLEEVGEK